MWRVMSKTPGGEAVKAVQDAKEGALDKFNEAKSDSAPKKRPLLKDASPFVSKL